MMCVFLGTFVGMVSFRNVGYSLNSASTGGAHTHNPPPPKLPRILLVTSLRTLFWRTSFCQLLEENPVKTSNVE